LVAVVALNENWSLAGDRVHEIFRGKLRLGPFGLIPSPAQNPFTFWRFFCLSRNSFCKFLRSCGVCKLNLFELCPALDEMNVCVVKSGQQQFVASINHFGLQTAP